jgi:hypothetical protein
MHEYGEPVVGEVLGPVVFVRVDWAWMSFLASQIVLSMVFLLAVIVQTAGLGVDVVKSSELASLFALDSGELQSSSLGPETVENMSPGLRKKLDKRIQGRLHNMQAKWVVHVERDAT